MKLSLLWDRELKNSVTQMVRSKLQNLLLLVPNCLLRFYTIYRLIAHELNGACRIFYLVVWFFVLNCLPTFKMWDISNEKISLFPASLEKWKTLVTLGLKSISQSWIAVAFWVGHVCHSPQLSLLPHTMPTSLVYGFCFVYVAIWVCHSRVQLLFFLFLFLPQ